MKSMMKTMARPRDKAELLRRLGHLRADSRARWGRMSAHQMVCHLSDSFRVAAGQKPVSSGVTWSRHTIVKWIALYAPMRWPPGIQTRPEIDQESGGTKPFDFSTDVAQLETLLEAFNGQGMRLNGAVHPIFGRMSETAWLRWAYLHTDHHLRQFGA